MATDLTLDQIAESLRAGAAIDDWFGVLRTISNHSAYGEPGDQRLARDALIRTLERRAELNGHSPMLDSIAIASGLYPYASPENLGVRDALEYETHRPAGLEREGIIFHRIQRLVYDYILNGESVILSAPTSFGKSLIVDAVLASGKIRNAAVVVPTIALIDETRRRLAARVGATFKIVTHPQQSLADSNVLVMTQERVLDVEELPDLDLFVIDEFYKLDPEADSARSYLLNQAFYRLRKRSRQFYLLGPNIESIPAPLNEMARIVVTDFATVALDTETVDTSEGDEEALVDLCRRLDGEPTIIFCRSPKQARTVTNVLLQRLDTLHEVDSTSDAADWAATNYHPEWSFVRALRHGIGLHHGRLPRSLGQLVVRYFNAGRLNFLVCTSTLIEGVNTSAKNVIIYDNKIAQRKYDYFTFNNIRGRGGRMFTHYVGRVFLFHAQPDERLRDVDFPVITQPSDIDPGLLVQMDEEDLTTESQSTLDSVLDEEVLPVEEVRGSPGVDPGEQVALARALRGMSDSQLRELSWTGLPTGPQLRLVCRLIWDELGGKRSRTSYVRTSPQLYYRLIRLNFDGLSSMLSDAVAENEDADEAVEEVLEFARNWAGFNFPRLLMALDRIQRVVLNDRGLPPGAYGFYASSVEALFQPRSAVALEEYGIPLQVALQLEGHLDLSNPLDDVLAEVRVLDVGVLPLTDFEKLLVADAMTDL